MRIEYKFRHSEPSIELTQYITERMHQLAKFEIKPVKVEFTFSEHKTSCRVDIHVRGDHSEMHAHALGEDFFQAVDEGLAKMARQMARHKSRVKNHKNPRKTYKKAS